MNHLRTLPILAVIAAATSGCYGYVQARGEVPRPAAAVVVSADVEYEPEYYDDYVVYYDAGGAPYYYVDGREVFIARSDRRYAVYVSSYRKHHVEYRRWHDRARRGHIERRGQWTHERDRQHAQPRRRR